MSVRIAVKVVSAVNGVYGNCFTREMPALAAPILVSAISTVGEQYRPAMLLSRIFGAWDSPGRVGCVAQSLRVLAMAEGGAAASQVAA